MKFVRDAAKWLGRIGRYSPLADAFFGAADQIEQISRLTDMIRTANEPPRSLEELQDRARSTSERGYQDHHIVGQHEQNRRQSGDGKIDRYENTVRIPTLKHFEINRWYSTLSERYRGLSPRDYLRGRSWDEQMRTGIDILRDKGVIE